METYIEYNGTRLNVPGDCAFTRSVAWETEERRSHDGTRTSQSISFLKRAGRKPHMYQLSFTSQARIMDISIPAILDMYESLAGQQVQLVYSGYPYGRVIISDVTLALSSDSIKGIYAVQVSLNLQETKIYTPSESSVSVRLV